MPIPKKFQIFDSPVVITGKDEVRLSATLSGWRTLHPALMKGTNEPDLQRLIVLELCGKQRMKILDRLLMRLGTVQRAKFVQRVKRLVG